MTPNQLADELGISPKTLRAWLRRSYPRHPAEKWSGWELTVEQIAAARARWGWEPRTLASRPRSAARRSRGQSDEAYVIDLCDEILGETALRQHRFLWLRGDPGRKGRRATLPVDAFYPDHRLVVEYRERQHDEPVAFFDRRETVSGVRRGDQRRIYDQRREVEIPTQGLRLIIVRPADLSADNRGRLKRSREADRAVLRAILEPT